MTGLWLASYVALWLIAALFGLLHLGVLRHVGLLQGQLIDLSGTAARSEPQLPALENDGPIIGSRIHDMAADTVNGFTFATTAPLDSSRGVLVVFMSPMCESCQHVVEPLNALAQNEELSIRVVVVMRADKPACEAFLSVFPMYVPVIADGDRAITRKYDVHRNPFGLMYDEHWTLVRKGVVGPSRDGLQALLGDPSAPAIARTHVFPPVGTPEMFARVEA